MGKAAGQDDEVEAFGQGGFGVPDHVRFLARDRPERDLGIAVAIGGGEDDDGCFHASGIARLGRRGKGEVRGAVDGSGGRAILR